MITCRLCGKQFKSISNTHLIKEHNGMTLREYIDMFGEFRSPQNIINRKIAAENIDFKARAIKHRDSMDKNRIENYGELTHRQLQICYGGLLGDFGIHAYSKNRLSGNYLECYHSKKQVPYLKWIQEEFKNFDCEFHKWTRYWDEYGREYTRYWITTCAHPTFTELRKECYGGGFQKHKTVTEEGLDKLEPLGLAVWYMDDGSFQRTNSPVIHTEGFTFVEHRLIQKHFQQHWNIPTSICKSMKSRKTKEQLYHLRILKDGRESFFNLISKHTIPMFEYKLGERT